MGGNTQSTQPAAHEFLEAAYNNLDYRHGALIDSIEAAQVGDVDATEWLEKGNWLELGKKINAEKIFFVNNDPVIVFRAFDSQPSESEILAAFRQTWCMTRSQYLYLALPGELRVYGLRQSPPQSEEDPNQLTKASKGLLMFQSNSTLIAENNWKRVTYPKTSILAKLMNKPTNA
ncbi:hypothetical protein ACFLXQ_05450 [Chloroflexota bacterium]